MKVALNTIKPTKLLLNPNPYDIVINFVQKLLLKIKIQVRKNEYSSPYTFIRKNALFSLVSILLLFIRKWWNIGMHFLNRFIAWLIISWNLNFNWYIPSLGNFPRTTSKYPLISMISPSFSHLLIWTTFVFDVSTAPTYWLVHG